MKKVALSISLLHTSGRDVLSGIFRHIESVADWHLSIWQLEDNPLTPQKLTKAIEGGLDGLIIAEVISDEFAKVLTASELPVVSICIRNEALERRTAPTALIRNDDSGIGRCGARYFAGLGQFKCFGFVPAGPFDWSSARENTFRDELATQRALVESFSSDLHPGSDEDIAKLAAWLQALEKPAAVMAACDWRAIQTLAACEQAKLRVPEQVSVLGVDNDELACSHATPPLSSILPGHEEVGRLAAQTLDRLMRLRNQREPVSLKTLTARTRQQIIERNSSRMLPPATALVERARQFIRENARNGICVKDVVAHVHVSRRLLEMRLREIGGETIRGLIESTRLNLLKRLLTSTRRPIAVLAKEAGFADANALAHLFKKRTGMSMRQFRSTAVAGGKRPQRR